MPQNQSTRRDFLKKSTAVAATAAAVPYFTSTQKAVANTEKNDRPRLGCIGTGGMGTGDNRRHLKWGDIVAACDVDSSRLKRTMDMAGGKAKAYEDYRKLLDRKDIDVISIGTPDHWHVKIAVEALESGRHVFCQKPVTLTLEENQLIRNACLKNKDKVFFVGTQQRSDSNKFLRAVNMVQKGLLGDIKKITVGINGGSVGGPFPKDDPPETLNWDMWLGQAPKVDYIKQRCHGTFRWWYEYSGGKFTDWGAHHIDIALWAINLLGDGQGPTEFDGTDAKHPVPYKDGYATVDDCYNSAHDYAVKCALPDGGEMVVTSRTDNGILFEGTKGRIFVNRGKIQGKPVDENWDEGKFGQAELEALYKGKPFEAHKDNFYRCLREGGLPVSDIYSHVQAMASCHLCAIAARLKRKIKWDPKKEEIVGDELAQSFFARKPRKGFEIPRV